MGAINPKQQKFILLRADGMRLRQNSKRDKHHQRHTYPMEETV